MRTSAFAITALFIAISLQAQTEQPTAPKPDYTRPTLIRILSVNDQPPKPEPRVEYHFGAVDVRALGTRWMIGYLPFFMPLSGSVNTGRGLGSNFPNPFALTHTEIPYTARSWRDRRAMSRELRRIDNEEKKRAKVKVNPE
jgi:hypothetical protein